MSHVPFSLRKDIPPLDRRGMLYVGAHLVGESANLKNSVSASALDELLGSARDAGYSVNLLDANRKKLIVTFDDGRRFGERLREVLDRHEATAIFFVSTDQYIPSYPELSTYAALTPANRVYLTERHLVGGHTDHHLDLGATASRDQRLLLSRSSDRFRAVFGFAPWCFAFPWGRYRGATLRAMRAEGIRYGFIAGAGLTATHPFIIPRVFLDGGDWPGGDLDYVLRQRRRPLKNLKLLLRGLHAHLTLMARPESR